VTFCANFLRLSESTWPVNPIGVLSEERSRILWIPFPGVDSPPGYDLALMQPLVSTRSHSAKLSKQRNDPIPGRGALSSSVTSLQLQWLGFGIRPASTSRLSTAIETLGLRSIRSWLKSHPILLFPAPVAKGRSCVSATQPAYRDSDGSASAGTQLHTRANRFRSKTGKRGVLAQFASSIDVVGCFRITTGTP
jgi:hypothetical protein